MDRRTGFGVSKRGLGVEGAKSRNPGRKAE